MKQSSNTQRIRPYVLTMRKAAEEAHVHAGALNSYVLEHAIHLTTSAALIRETAALLAHQVQHFYNVTKNTSAQAGSKAKVRPKAPIRTARRAP